MCETWRQPRPRRPSDLCADAERDATVLVVEGPRDVEAGRAREPLPRSLRRAPRSTQPAEGSEAANLGTDRLFARLERGGVEEVVLGTDPDLGGGDGVLARGAGRAALRGVRVTRLARGLPAGSALVYLHRGVIADALEGRMELRPRGAR
ncbi:MAG: hypothetical protein R3F34_11780 [Planctomycetota bacterium]